MTVPLSLARFPLHLGLGASALPQPEFTGMEWYEAYGQRTAADGAEGRLVSLYTFTESWTSWERHPAGAEAVICTAGEITLIQEMPDGLQRVTLRPGEYAINPAGVWHTADVTGSASALFITAGQGTENRAR
ncbi:cupin domain-containing protein [Reyranella sp.]|uniref:cupin domain-containing protein n=1 Tax=Reyranella sp. TaxID=1929291 RepID=UPI003BA8EE04